MPGQTRGPTELERTFGTNVRTRREQLGVTQVELGDRLAALGADGANQASVAALEAGRRRPRLGDFAAICAALNCSLADLLQGDDWAVAAITGHWTPPADYEEKVRQASDDREDAALAQRFLGTLDKWGFSEETQDGLRQWVASRYGSTLLRMREEAAEQTADTDMRMARQRATKTVLGAVTRDYMQERAQ